MYIRLIVSLFAFAILATMVMWLGPLLEIGQSRPLEAWWARLLLTLGLAMLIFLPLAWRWWRLRKAEDALKSSLTRQQEMGKAQADKLQEIFSRAINTLKIHQRKTAWYKSSPGLYELPWYVFIGPPGSGKTTALRNAGLRFPLQQHLGQDVIQGVGGTRHCDWWFSDQAVLIDTAGRFTTQDSDQHTDAVAWNSFLGLLKKHRPKQALNGVLLTLSVQDLLGPSQKRHALAMTIHARLQELVRSLGVCPPVYVLVTKLDWLEGFQETHQQLSEQEREQAWGVNLNHPTNIEHALSTELPEGLGNLEQHLLKRLGDRLLHEPQARVRTRLLEFPHAFAQLRPSLMHVLTSIFKGEGPFDQAIQLRGVYFTSGTQDGTVFDRMLAGFQQAPAAAQPGQGQPQGKSFFIRNTLLQVIFPEQHLVGHASKRALFEMLSYWGVVGGALLVAIFLGGAWWISHQHNSELLTKVDAAVPDLEARIEQLPKAGPHHLEALFGSLDDLLGIVPERSNATTHGMGLSQYAHMAQAQKLSYQRALQTSLMPHVAQRFEEGLAQSLTGEPELVYEYLKAYLMLYEPSRFDGAFLEPWVIQDWSATRLAVFPPELRNGALHHLRQAIALGAPSQLPPKDTVLIEQARRVIGHRPLDQRLHQRMLRLYRQDAHPEFSVLQAAGPAAVGIFSRASGKNLQEGVPSVFTRPAYYQTYLPGLPEQAKQLLNEQAWVLGTTTPGPSQSVSDLVKLARQRYVEDYIRTWDAFLQDIRLQRPSDFSAAVQLARALAAPQSPLYLFLKGASQHTRLAGAAPQVAEQAEKNANASLASALPSTMALHGADSVGLVQIQAPVEQRVDTYFHDLNQLFKDDGQGYAPVSAVLNQLYAQLAAVQAAQNSKSPPPPAEQLNALQMNASLMPEPIESMVSQLAGHGSAQGRAAERANLNSELRPLLEVCQRTVGNRYPVQATASADILTQDFARFFGPGGLMDQFFQSHLAGLVDTGHAVWRFKPGSDGSQAPPAAALLQFQRAQRIRDVFFGQSASGASFEVEMRLVNSTAKQDVFYLDNNGKLAMFSVQHEPRHRIRWGGQLPSDTVSIRASEGKPKVFKGPWALFRLFDTASLQATDRPELVRATFVLEGREFEFELMANSAFNPLTLAELRQFRCPGGL
ncbi:type VI secretion system membrane subunit TssM [Limnobacter sp.]|uniref:type VI secretion system membrane subunit TssM n=1 Tax=Limnobacter sp. TaxID=2003368 RepID=UPI0035167FDD